MGDLRDDELLDELATSAPPRPIGEVLKGDPHTVMAELRGDETADGPTRNSSGG